MRIVAAAQDGHGDAVSLLFRRIGWRIGGVFRFADGGDAIHVEFFVVGIARDSVDLESLHQQDANANVGFFVRREPDFVVDVALLEDEARSLLQIRNDAARKSEIPDKIGLEPRDVVRFLINPDHAR